MPRPPRRAFTLIELLVVLAILSVLAAILFPVFASAREKARQAACASNLKQLGLAALLYVQDNDATWPVAQYSLPDGTIQYWACLKVSPNQFDLTHGLLQPYEKNTQVGRCPSWTGQAKYGAGNGYGYNWGMLGSDLYLDPASTDFCNYTHWPDAPAMSHPAEDADVLHPAETIAFADAGFYAGGQMVEAIFIDPPSQTLGNPTINFRHGDSSLTHDPVTGATTDHGYANVAFCDGHMKAYKQEQVTDALFRLN